MEGLSIRPLTGGDVEAGLTILRASPETAQWSAADFERIAAQDASPVRAWVADCAGAVGGFVITRCLAGEVEVLNLAVDHAHRRQGIAQQLLEHALAAARADGAGRAFLEVRESNHAAIRLYQRCGFGPASRRENYYTAPVEAALILYCDL